MSALAAFAPAGGRPRAVRVEDLGELVPVSRAGGQGRVYRPQFAPASLGDGPVVVKLYRRAPPAGAGAVLADMVAWGRTLAPDERARLHTVTAWPLAVVHAGPRAAGTVMRDVSGRFAVPFAMPSGRRERVLLTLEHLLGADGYLELRGLGVRLGTMRRAQVAERVCAGLAFLHRHGIAASDIAPNNLLVSFRGATEVCFIDCDSMVFRGRGALVSVQTGDWNVPAGETAGHPRGRRVQARAGHPAAVRALARRAGAGAPSAVCAGRAARSSLPLAGRGRREPADGGGMAASAARAAGGRWADERYPGPAPAPRLVPAVAEPPAPAARAVAVAVAAAPAPRAPARQAPAPAVAPAAGQWLQRSVVVLWILAGSIVLLLVLSRLFAAAVPVPDPGAGSPAGAGAGPYYYSPGYYPGGRAGRGFIQVP